MTIYQKKIWLVFLTAVTMTMVITIWLKTIDIDFSTSQTKEFKELKSAFQEVKESFRKAKKEFQQLQNLSTTTTSTSY